MNIDRIIPKAIRENDSPIEDMLEALEEFADTIGGPAWRQRRALSTAMGRSICLYLDEDHEQLSPDDQPDYGVGEGELIEVTFAALREPGDDDEIYNTYKLSYATSLPSPNLATIPDVYALQLAEELDDDPESDDSDVVVETNTVEFTVYQEDGVIHYNQAIDYAIGDIVVRGQTYNSEIEPIVVHGLDVDNASDECVAIDGTIERGAAADIAERIFLAEELSTIITDRRQKIELLGNSLEEHARRVLALLSLVGCNVRPYRPSDRD